MSHAETDAKALAMSFEYAISVLLVDDQALVGEAVRRALLADATIKYHHCIDPTAALATAKALKPTVILQDLVMPKVDGLELVLQYRADPATSGIPIIVLSTKEDPTVKSNAFRAGANDYLVKLPDSIELIARIRYHSRAYVSQLERDEAYRALSQSQQKLVETNLELERLTQVDGLTGLSNRRYFNERIDAEWKRGLRSKSPLSIMMIDVDHFKLYNDTYGHLGGDEVLKGVALTLKQCCRRSTDLAARYGGEEFAIILPETPYSELQQLAEKLCLSVAALGIAHSASTVAKCVTISVGGGAIVPTAADSFFRLVDEADKALYQAKHAGRNRAVTRELSTAGPTAAMQ